MKLSKLLCGTDIKLDNDTEVQGISYDSRRVKKGDVFIGLRGINTDGASFAAEAASKGAVAYIGESIINGVDIPQYVTSSSRRTLAFAYANLYSNPQNKLKIIGVTGTNGKSSTAYVLRTILAHSGYKTALIGTIKSMILEKDYFPTLEGSAADKFKTMTTPDPDSLYLALSQMVEQGVEVLVMEVSSHALALEKLAPIRFESCIFTNLSKEHLDFHGTMDNYFLAKAGLFDKCRKGIINVDDLYGKRLIESVKCISVGFGIATKCDYYAENLVSKGVLGSEYVLRSKNARFKIKTRIPGKFTVYNTLAAAVCAKEMGIDLMSIQNAIYSLNGICGRLERVKLGFCDNSIAVYIDYAHTPFALENLLNCVNEFRESGQRIVTLFGCGGERDKDKRAEMGKIAVEKSDFVIITSDNPRGESPEEIIAGILSEISAAKNYTVIENRKKAIEYSIKNAIEGDIILLVGKGHEQYEIDKKGLHPFSETEIAEKAAEERKH